MNRIERLRRYFVGSRRFPVAVASIFAVAAVLTFEAVCADVMDRYSYTSRLETDIVRVRLENYMVSGDDVLPAEKRTVMPNEKVSLIPRLTNLGTEAYVRVRLVSSSSAVSEKDIYGLGSGWIRRGDYFYFSEPLSTGGMADIFEGIHVPGGADRNRLKDFSVTGYADAVQSRNFHPDFSSESPWGNLDISESKSEKSMVFSGGEKKDEYSLIYDEDGFHGDTDNLFEGFSVRVDGDKESGRLRLCNSSGSDIRISFSSVSSGKLLSKRMNIKMDIDGKNVYDGRIFAMGDVKFEDICLSDNEEKIIGYELLLPEKSGNLYTNLSDAVRWTFKAEKTGGVSTGDLLRYGMLSVFAVAAGVLFILSMYFRRKESILKNGCR